MGETTGEFVMSRRSNAEYIVYDNNNGDAIIAIGTIKECAEQLGKKCVTLRSMMTKAKQGILKKYTFYRLED